MFGSIYDNYSKYLMPTVKLKKKSNVKHRDTCPQCGRTLVNTYYDKDSEQYLCKQCLDELEEAKYKDV